MAPRVDPGWTLSSSCEDHLFRGDRPLGAGQRVQRGRSPSWRLGNADGKHGQRQLLEDRFPGPWPWVGLIEGVWYKSI